VSNGFWQRGEHGGTAEAYREKALLSAPQSAGHLHIVAELCDGVSRALQKELPDSGESHSARGSIKQGISKMTFQLPDLLAQRRLRHPQLCRCPSKMQGLGDGQEVAQMPELNLIIHI
jgi:hypothetical protein